MLRSRFLLLAVLISLIGLIPQFIGPINGDSAFLLYAAGRVLDGAKLYVDLLEINPPLIIWLNIPVVAASRLLDVEPILGFRVAVVLLIVLVVGFSNRLLRITGLLPASHRRGAMLALLFGLMVLPRLEFGEREHLTLILVLPYLVLAATRLERQTVSGLLGLLAGLAAAAGIALKPHFILLWLAREAIVMRRMRSRVPTPEGMLIVALGLVYIAAVWIVTPEYFALVGELGPAYQRFIHNSIPVTALLGDGAPLSLGALLIAVGAWRLCTRPGIRLVLVGSLVAAYVAAVMQQKGWRYHFLPAITMGWLLMAGTAYWTRRGTRMDTVFRALGAAGAITVALTIIAASIRQVARPDDPAYASDPSVSQLLPIFAEFRGQPAAVLSTNMASGFPLTVYAGTKWPLRFPHMWLLVAEYDSAMASQLPLRFRKPGERTTLENKILTTTADDIARSRPAVVAVLRTGPDTPQWGMRRFDLLRFLGQDQRFVEAFREYDSIGYVGQYGIYVRRNLLHPVLPVASSDRGHEASPATVRFESAAPLMALVWLASFGISLRIFANANSSQGNISATPG